jgi:hypothetical protein
MKVKSDRLMIIAGVVWGLAGANILRIGVSASHGVWAPWMVLGAAVIFAAFFLGIFNNLVNRHTVRIGSYGSDRVSALKFFDAKSYVMMAVMMTVGICLRASGLLPDPAIAFFYTGLGAALLLAGVRFLGNWPGVRAQAHARA